MHCLHYLLFIPSHDGQPLATLNDHCQAFACCQADLLAHVQRESITSWNVGTMDLADYAPQHFRSSIVEHVVGVEYDIPLDVKCSTQLRCYYTLRNYTIFSLLRRIQFLCLEGKVPSSLGLPHMKSTNF